MENIIELTYQVLTSEVITYAFYVYIGIIALLPIILYSDEYYLEDKKE